MLAFYCDHFVLPLPEGHRFPMSKYRLLRERVAGLAGISLREPAAVSEAELRRAHTADYVARAVAGELTRAEVRRIGFPWSPEMIERSRRSAGATWAAAWAALEAGVAVNLAGGTHHAFADRGEGFCVFNDAAVAARTLQAAGRVGRVLVVDTDVHQGNGTAAIFRDDPTVFTFSLHGARNFPFHKEISDLDLELPDASGDAEYLEALDRGLATSLAWARWERAELAIWVSGADPFVGDTLGRLAVSKAGLAERDVRVLRALRSAGLAVVVVMAGGYAADVADTVDIHCQTVKTALDFFTPP
ncbi:MAG: histone deacetylase [Thermoanaerobaculia bacterium]|nr:histone deacetylase [Thermoanaerobaculia bacterium]